MPDWRQEIRERLRDAGLPTGDEDGVVEEIAQHLEMQFAELSPRLGPERARESLLAHLDVGELRDALARRRQAHAPPPTIGGPSTTRGVLDALWQDASYGIRSLRRTPAFTIVAVVSLALGIGATTAIFGLLDAVLLERLPIRHPEQLVQLQRSTGKGLLDRFGYDQFLALAQAPGQPRMEATVTNAVTVVTGERRDYPNADLVSGGFFDMLGVHPLLGRTITRDDEQSVAPVVVVSEDFWREQLAGDPAAMGHTMTINDHAFTVIGVVPRAFRGLVFGGSFTLAVPLSVTRLVGLADLRAPNRATLVSIFARLPAGQDVALGSRMFDAVFQQCCAAASGPPMRIVAIDASRGTSNPKSDLREQYRRILISLMAGVVVLLLIACANVGNLLLARAAARQRELAVRMSLGATRSRVVRQLLTESVEIAAFGAVLGVVLARLGTSMLSHNLPPAAGNLADMVVLRPSVSILAFAVATTIACTLLFGVLPALRGTRVDIVTPLKDGARGSGPRSRSLVDGGIVVAQVAMALVLVSAASLFVSTLRNLKQFDNEPALSRVLLAQIDTRGTIYSARGMTAIYPDLLERMRRIPGVTSVALSTTVPVFGGRSLRDFIRVPGFQPSDDGDYSAWYAAVTPDYFTATGIGLVRGRAFTTSDAASSQPVAIVSEAFAHHFFGGRDPIGATIEYGAEGPAAHRLQVVGVARDARYDDLRAPPTEIYYEPVSQSGDLPLLVLSLRTNGDPVTLAPLLRHEVDAVAPGIRVRRLAGFEQALNDALARERLAAALATLFGAVAVGLAAVGLYGVVAYGVSRRTQEIGVRMALGARPVDALMLVVRHSLSMTVAGVALGIPLALVAASALRSELFGVGARDPRTMIGAAVLLVGVGAAAAVIPARRAARVDPVEALRAE